MPSLTHNTGRLVFYLLFIASIISGCGGRETAEVRKPKNEKILVRLGKGVITIDDYKGELALLPANYRNNVNFQKDQFLEILINKYLLLQEAERKNLQNSENVKKLFKKVKEEIIIQEFIDREVSSKAGVSDSEIENYYRENQNNYVEPAKIRACHILVDSELVAKKVQEDLKNGRDFAELAKEYSLDIPSKDKGGDLGYFSKGTFLPEFELACDKLNIGEISEVIKTELGYHIIKVLDKKEAEPKKLEEIKDDIKSELLLDKEISLYNNLLQELRKNQNIAINEKLLESIDLSRMD
jgi:peptidyl-prolyl cis-trans isomerase C